MVAYTTDQITGNTVMQKMRSLIEWCQTAIGGFDGDIQTAITTAQQALAKANSMEADVTANTGAIASLQLAYDALVTRVTALLKSGEFSADGSTVYLTFTKENDTTAVIAMPVASISQAGIMNPAQVQSITDLGQRVSVLESRQSTYIVEFASSTPSQMDITTAYVADYPTAPNPPIGGTIVWDVTRNLEYVWNSATSLWVQSVTPTTPIWTASTPGIVVSSATAGQIQAETDGTGSVNGWDALGTRVTQLETFAEDEAGISLNKVDGTGVTIQLMNAEATPQVLSSVKIKNVEATDAVSTDECTITKAQYDAIGQGGGGYFKFEPDSLRFKSWLCESNDGSIYIALMDTEGKGNSPISYDISHLLNAAGVDYSNGITLTYWGSPYPPLYGVMPGIIYFSEGASSGTTSYDNFTNGAITSTGTLTGVFSSRLNVNFAVVAPIIIRIK